LSLTYYLNQITTKAVLPSFFSMFFFSYIILRI
jgi:hypothetical protein